MVAPTHAKRPAPFGTGLTRGKEEHVLLSCGRPLVASRRGKATVGRCVLAAVKR